MVLIGSTVKENTQAERQSEGRTDVLFGFVFEYCIFVYAKMRKEQKLKSINNEFVGTVEHVVNECSKIALSG